MHCPLQTCPFSLQVRGRRVRVLSAAGLVFDFFIFGVIATLFGFFPPLVDAVAFWFLGSKFSLLF